MIKDNDSDRQQTVQLSIKMLNTQNDLCLFQASKPLMEKRRRERINNCLDQLKTLILEATKKDVSFPRLNFPSLYLLKDVHAICLKAFSNNTRSRANLCFAYL